MKKVTALLLAMLLCFSALAGCSQSEPQGSGAPPSNPSQNSSSPSVPVTITVWHDGDEGSLSFPGLIGLSILDLGEQAVCGGLSSISSSKGCFPCSILTHKYEKVCHLADFSQ